ncbi:unnamed protein product [Triticum turgidum subsp. durum]|uniref:Dirigent protein n=1 Tax=Triticum turgidum subsp. durum TaxID=4567 RepID=A0A9R1QVC8_TRITD|nr:unnamed protein product [Triticum turgidum subsp. durum]
MAAEEPAYFRSVPLQQEIHQRELRFELYMRQIDKPHGDQQKNQEVIVDKKQDNEYGTLAVQDWTVRDGPGDEAKDVARAQGLHLGASSTKETTIWFTSFSIVFTGDGDSDKFPLKFKGSSLQVMGTWNGEGSTKLAITGGTGEFARAQGFATHTIDKDFEHHGSIRKLVIDAMCLTFPTPKQVRVKKSGPWGGNGGEEHDILELKPQRLESVTITSGIVINSIAFTCIDQAQQKHNIGRPWGRDGELPADLGRETIHFTRSEIVKEVSGTFGTFRGDTIVTSLTFVTTLRTHGPFGNPNGTAFSVPNTNIVGFFVRAGSVVNALGVYELLENNNY